MIDLEFMRDVIMEVHNNANEIDFYPIMNSEIEKGKDFHFVFSQLLEYEKLGLFNKPIHETDGGFCVRGLSQKGHELYLKIYQEKNWKQYKKDLNKTNSSRLNKLAEFIGIMAGEFYKHSKNDK